MLNFFRKYEKYFFIVITAVIVVSFSFFGTYGTLEKNAYVDKPAFTALNGKSVKASELEEFIIFLGSDQEDKVSLGGAWGPNFLNDGVIKKDFLGTGLAQQLMKPYLAELREEFEPRLQKERRFTPYQHPQVRFISANNAWKAVAPQIPAKLEALKAIEDPVSEDAFDARVQLFLAQRQFPAYYLHYMLRQQEKQNSWIQPDPALDRTDLSLFGYHTLSDWFGHGFQRLVAQFIINSAAIAEQRGYTVSKAEVLADLYRRAEESFQQNADRPNLGVVDVQQYIAEQLRRMRMDESTAVAIWEKVLLFRRLFDNAGGAALVDNLTLAQFEQEAHQSAEGELYHLPHNLQLKDLKDLQKFELYLAAVSDRSPAETGALKLPENFKTAEEVAKKYPELVQKRYLVNVAKVNKQSLQSKVGMKIAWEWELEDANWEELKKAFPELGVKSAANKEERQEILNNIEKKTQIKIDKFARQKIVELHPEWLEEALNSAKKEMRVVGVPQKGEAVDFPEVKDLKAFIAQLDRYPETEKELSRFSADDQIFYRIEVLDKSPQWEVMSFAEAQQQDVLGSILERYLKSGGDKQVERIVGAIRKQNKKTGEDMIADYAASRRLFSHVDGLRERFKKDASTISSAIFEANSTEANGAVLPQRKTLKEQWKLIHEPHVVRRGDGNEIVDTTEVFKLKEGEWSDVFARPDGDNAFFQVKKIEAAKANDLFSKAERIQQMLASETKKALMQGLMEEMTKKGALSLQQVAQN